MRQYDSVFLACSRYNAFVRDSLLLIIREVDRIMVETAEGVHDASADTHISQKSHPFRLQMVQHVHRSGMRRTAGTP